MRNLKPVRLYLHICLIGIAVALCPGASLAQQATPTMAQRQSSQIGRVQQNQQNRQVQRGQQVRQQSTSANTVRDASPSATLSGSGKSGRSGIRVNSASSAFEPAKNHSIEYGSVPELGPEATMTLSGPMTAIEFLDTLSLATGWNIVATPAIDDLVLRFWVNELSPAQAIEVLKFNGLYYEFDPKTSFLYVMTSEELLQRRYGGIQDHEFFIEHADLADMEAVLVSLMSPAGRIIADPRTSSILVFDTLDNLEYMVRTVGDLDVPLKPITIDFNYVDADILFDSIEPLLSERGQLQIDPRTHRLIVIDRATNQKDIRNVVEMMDRPLETRSWILNYADPTDIADQVESLVPREMGTIVVNEDIHQITITAIPHRLREIAKLINQWDKKRSQVQIEAYLLTASTNVSRNLGINWSYFGSNGSDPFSLQVGSGGSPDFSTPPGSGQSFTIGQLPRAVALLNPLTGLPITDLAGNTILDGFRGNKVSAVINYLESTGDVTILAHPRVTVQDGEEALFENTTQVPFSQSTSQFGSNVSNSFNSVSTISFIDVGTILRVLPRIAQEGNILLDITSEDSNFIPVTFVANGQENTVPQKTQNRARTQVLVHDQDTIVLGGLRTSNFSDEVDRIPFLGNLPIIGRIFRSTRKEHMHSELLIFITPTIIDTRTHPEAIKLARADDDIAVAMRHDKKGAFGRAVDKLSKRQNEINVAIGQLGGILARGKFVTLESLRKIMEDVNEPAAVRVVIREHPRAPEAIAQRITEMAEEAGLKVSENNFTSAFVPSMNRPETVDIGSSETDQP